MGTYASADDHYVPFRWVGLKTLNPWADRAPKRREGAAVGRAPMVSAFGSLPTVGPMRWNLAQRVVFVIAYALALWILWEWLESAGWHQFGDDSGWFNYAPNSGVGFSGGLPALRTNLPLRAGTQLSLVVLWAAPSVWLLRAQARSSESGSPATEG